MVPIGTAWTNAIRRVSGVKDSPSWFDAELAWYVNERDGEMGVRGVPIEPGVGADPEQHDGISDHQVRAATRSRKIEAALHRLHERDRLLLQACHFRISPRAHKERHKAQEECIAQNAERLLICVAVFRRSLRGARC